MPEATDKRSILYQNLLDAGCDEKTIKSCMQYAEKGERDKLTALLSKQKNALLEYVHTGQKRIDCLDFLVYQINKINKQEELL